MTRRVAGAALVQTRHKPPGLFFDSKGPYLLFPRGPFPKLFPRGPFPHDSQGPFSMTGSRGQHLLGLATNLQAIACLHARYLKQFPTQSLFPRMNFKTMAGKILVNLFLFPFRMATYFLVKIIRRRLEHYLSTSSVLNLSYESPRRACPDVVE